MKMLHQIGVLSFGKALLMMWVFVIANSGCTLSANISELSGNSSQDAIKIQKKIFFDTTVLNISEGSAAIVSVQLSDKLSYDIEFSLSVSGDISLLAPVASGVVIPAGSLSVPITLQTIDDLVFQGPQVIQVKLQTNDETMLAEPNSLTLNIQDNDLPSALFLTSSQSVNEDTGAVMVTAQLNAVALNPVSIPLVISGSATQGAGDDYTLSSATINIPVGQVQGSVTISLVDDLQYESTETLILTMGSPTNAIVGSPSVFTLTINDSDLGIFSISGISGGADVTTDAFLADGLLATINWSASPGATAYDVTIYANDGTTLVCPTQTSVGTNYNFTLCPLTGGTTYKVAVIGTNGAITQAASNSLYSFYINRAPVASNDGPVRIMKNAAAVTLQVLSASDSASRGTAGDSDPDAGDTLSIASVSQGSGGGSVSHSATDVTYTVPSASFTGIDTFTYTLSDNHGATTTATVTIHVMDTYTWTGKVSANWNVNGNWCGTITNNACNGSTGFPNSTLTNTMTAIFDGTCSATGHSCNANVNVASQAYGVDLGSTYTGTLTQVAGAGNTLTLGAAGYKQAAGTFAGGTAAMSMTGAFNLSGGSFTMPTATVSTLNNWQITGTPTFGSAGSTLLFGNGVSTLTHSIIPGSVAYNHVSFSGWASIYNLNNGTFSVNGNLTLGDGSGGQINVGTINVYGNVSVPNAGLRGSAYVVLAGNVAGQTLNGSLTTSTIPHLQIAADTNPVTITGTIRSRGNWIYSSSGTFTTSGTTITFGTGSQTLIHTIIPGPVSYDNITFAGWSGTYLLTGTMNVSGTLTLDDGYGNASLSSGTINAYGDVILSRQGIFSGSGVLVIAGNASGQTIDGSAGTGYAPNIQIAAGTNPVTLLGTIKSRLNWTYVSSGAFTSTGSTLQFGSGTTTMTHSFNPGPVTYENITFAGWESTLNLVGTSLLLSGTLTVTDPTGTNQSVFRMNGFSLTAQTNVVLNNQNLIKGAGVLTVNSVVAGTGALFGGTVSP